MTVQLCASRQILARQPIVHAVKARTFHASAGLYDDSNHYETLNISTSATHGEIKKQFYRLSKENHPDLHPDDPTKARRFLKISEAYATLGSEEKKARYDRDFLRASSSGAAREGQTPHGSHSSATTGPGGRPASGLSRRRTQFRGPPPSFYRSGGWGNYGEKRGEHASRASHAHEAAGPSSASSSSSAAPGTGPAGFARGFDGDVPHFDNRAHTHTHSEIERTRHRTRRNRPVSATEEESEGTGGGAAANFLTLTAILGLAMALPGLFFGLIREGNEAAKHQGRKRPLEAG